MAAALVHSNMPLTLLVIAVILGLVLIPLGLPGTFVILGAGIAYHALVPGSAIGLWTLIGVGILAAIAELLEWSLAGRYARKYGGSSRAGWGAIIGGLVGAFMGVPVPIVGSVIGAFAGAFVGAFIFEWSGTRDHSTAARVAWGAFLGRVAAAAMKVAIGFVMGVWLVGKVFLR
jgi:uncharacterized protein YqgC (DUF456 family)